MGYYHAAAITEHGQVLTWGRGNSGQLGTGSPAPEYNIRTVTALINNNIVDVHCGESHSVALNDKGEVFTWGGGQMGQLGHGDFSRQSLPIKVANFDERIVSISCGKRHSVAISENGALFTWGSNEYGQLGRQVTRKLTLATQST